MDQVGEAGLLAAAGAGRALACGDGNASRRVDAALLRRCCHELRDQIDPRGVWLQHAAITGSVDLSGLEVPFPLRFDENAARGSLGAASPACPVAGCS
jgi:hypothetical protein